MELTPNMQKHKSLITAYANGTLRSNDMTKAQDLLIADEALREFFDHKRSEREFIKQLIPQRKMEQKDLHELKKEIEQVTNEILPREKLGFLKKIVRFMDKPMFTVRF